MNWCENENLKQLFSAHTGYILIKRWLKKIINTILMDRYKWITYKIYGNKIRLNSEQISWPQRWRA